LNVSYDDIAGERPDAVINDEIGIVEIPDGNLIGVYGIKSGHENEHCQNED
jgi:hypothetical protein